MAVLPQHTPYGEGTVPFSIGLKPLDLAHWLEVDERLDFYLEEKARLAARYPDRVFRAEDGTHGAQREVLEMLLAHLETYHSATHRRDGDLMRIGARCVDLSGDEPPLMIAAQLIQEDLVLMRRNSDGSGWRITAASLCFPSSWSLGEKFSKALADVHAPVPGFERGTRNANLIDRIFDNLQVDLPVYRLNWSLYDNNDLHHPFAKSGEGSAGYGDASFSSFMRVEHQTLHKLPVSDDILFTIRVHVDPVAVLAWHPDKARICSGFIAALRRLDDAQLAYKGMDKTARDTMIATLAVMAAD